ncbi:oligoendopeptidase F family protein [Acidaminobacter sp. JC074]|uniref:M3 family oligoendopeptidase n=1 Tax=Acidaminobacter sp. JC074 TaxID=2530199 RepID=UPI001F0E0B16|nr:M3 family oligoendopeptidase [Acidaminobacter sp. JC074]MCH4887750.1 oligoendopeptidase F family protein [Acidaminobacter sp. JC074]
MKSNSKLFVLVLSLLLVFTAIGCEDNTGNEPVENALATENQVENQTPEATAEETETEAVEDTETDLVEDTETDQEVEDPGFKRSDVPDEYKWDLEKVYTNTDAFMADVENVRKSFKLFSKNQNTFTSNYKTFSETLMAYEDTKRINDKLYVFATLQAHTDTSNTDFSDLEDIAAELDTDLSEATSYFYPEIANMDSTLLNSYMANEEMKELQPYVDRILRSKPYILSVEEEALLAQAQILYEVPESIYDAYNYNTDLSDYLPEPDFTLFWTGTREDRKDILTDYYAKTTLGNDLLAEIYESEIKKNTFFAKASNFDSALDAALFNDGITRNEYDKVFEITHDNLDILHKWISIKKELLDVDKVYYYDQYSPLIETEQRVVYFDEAKEIIYAALAPLGDKYISDLREGFGSRWADVFATDDKYEGGYQWGTFDTDPFVLLNYYGQITDVSTAAHEMGHALNFKYTNETQDYFSAIVPIFNAEIASTTNEVMVFEYRIANAQTKMEKQEALLNYIELIENTIFTQMIYADFEKRAYEAYEAGEPISAELFNNLMGQVLVEYYGPDYGLDEVATYQWSEIPHFYNAYYVYKYATGLSAGLNFSDNILNGDQEDVDKYLTYLSAGSSELPLPLLKKAGVDFSTGEPLQKAFDKFESLVDEFYETLK